MKTIKKIIILKYGELVLKKKNKNFFIKTLKTNIIKSLNGISNEIYYDFGRMYIQVAEKDIDIVIAKLKNVFGIYEIIVGYLDENRDINHLKMQVLALLKESDFTTFRITTKRSDKSYPLNSMEINQVIAGEILKNIKNIKVNLEQPDLTVNIEIRFNEVLYYFTGIKGLGGYPVGTLGKGLLMISGGIDSPVAGFLTIKKGVRIDAVYFESLPHTSLLARKKVIDLIKVLTKYNYIVKLHIINFTEIQEAILKNIPKEYLITIMRRMMYRISNTIAHKSKCHVLINGESIGQVASQTLTSLKVINEVVNLPVIRPLVCYDKSEIIALAQKIGTFDISIRPYEDCCTIFVPPHPIINPSSKRCLEYEKLIPYQELIYKAISVHEIIKIDENYQEKDYNNIL